MPLYYCPILGMEEKPSHLGKDFSVKNSKCEYLNSKQILISNDRNFKLL